MQTLPRVYKRSANAPALPPISLERIQTDDNTDTLTQATVKKMCALVLDSATDPVVQQAAAYAKNHFACGSSDPAALAWGVWWYVKHCVKFRSDEGTMMHVQQRGLDLLTAPAVLVRMKDPSEDCDGFTMLTAAMLTILGIPVLIATVAVDLDDPRRWSHVFLCAVINGRVMPLDTSHGKAPGWMVPKSRINRWQTWKLDGTPADVPIPTNHGLHGYVATGMGQVRRGAVRMPVVLRRAGMGQIAGCNDTACDENGENCVCLDNTSSTTATAPATTDTSTTNAAQACGSGYSIVINSAGQPICQQNGAALTPAQAGLTAAQQAQLVAATGNAAVSLIRTASGGPYQVAGTNLIYNPATGQLSQSSTGLTPLNLSSVTAYLPYILGGGLLILLLGRK